MIILLLLTVLQSVPSVNVHKYTNAMTYMQAVAVKN